MRALAIGLGAALVLTACGKDSGSNEESSQGSMTETETDSASATESASDTSNPTASASTDPTETDSGFIEPPDGGIEGQCSPADQDCPEGQKCTAYATEPGACCVDANKCVDIIGNGQEFDDCIRTEDNDDCDKGLFCITKSSGSTGMGICKLFCGSDADCPGGMCIQWNDGVNPTCEYECNPLLQDCEGNNTGCYPAFDSFICHTVGYDQGEGQDGSSCFTVQSCVPGLICVGADVQESCAAQRCCTNVCDTTGDPSQCPAATEECVEWFVMGEAPPGFETVGVCIIPP